jgi:hypothetical protein
MRDLTKLTLEPRTAIMAKAEVVWEDQPGILRSAFAMIEDTSPSGACIRVSTAISVGAKLNIKWHLEQFSGVVKYCRREGEEYVLGIQRDASENLARSMVLLDQATSRFPTPSPTKVQDAPPLRANKVQKLSKSASTPGPKAASTVDPEVPAVAIPKMTDTSNVTPENQAKTDSKGVGLPASEDSLLPLEDIYRAVGIISLRLGYSSKTVSDMLDSDQMRGMTNDVKRASVLMALEAAGISAEDVLQDSAQRLYAIDAYEAGQRKRFEEFEAQKSQENAQIQSAIERITANFLDRINHNLGEVAFAREAFLNWQTIKQKEAQRISEAVAFFANPPGGEQPIDSKPALQAVGAASKK